MPEPQSSPTSRPLTVVAGALLLAVVALLGYARFGDPATMPPQVRKLAETSWVHNPRAFVEVVTPNRK